MKFSEIPYERADLAAWQKSVEELTSKFQAAETFEDGEVTDFANDSEYVRDTARTGRFAWVWIVLIVLAIISLVIIFMPASRG